MLSRSTLAIFSVLAATTALTFGCSSSDVEEGEADLTAGGLCGEALSWSGQCAAEKAICDDALLETCDGVTSLLSASVLDAAAACLREQACGASPTKCLASSITKAETTEAHKKLAEGFCGCLLTGKSECIEGIRKGDGPAKAALTLARPLGDELADAVTKACTTTPGCSATFSACAQGVVTKKLAEALSPESASCLAKSVLDSASAAAEEGTKSGEPAEPDEGSSGGGAADEPPPSCTPKTCEDLGKSCGSHDDGCGDMVDCGLCPTTTCAADAVESNNTSAKAKDLGGMTDSPNSSKSVANLTLPDGDVDWFKTKVSDGGFDGNPDVKANTGRNVEVSVFYVCDSGGNESSCPDASDKADATLGKGCRGTTAAHLKAKCSGINDSGTAYVRVRKLASDNQCVSYKLDVTVE